MCVASKPRLLQKVGRCLPALGVITMLSGVAAARAEDLDQGKSGPRLFADSCVTCHRSARGLAKGRFSLTLYLFLQQHYVSNSGAAKELTSYLESVDSPPPDRHPASAKRSPRAPGASGSSPRPPAPVQGR
jgi:mono/diheme cytochrome c family protein